jgi:hypothetical protein
VESLRFQNAPDPVAIQTRQKMGDHEGEIIQSEVGKSASSADHGTLFFGRLPGQLVRARGVIETVLDTALAPLADGLGADPPSVGPGCQ